MIFHLFKVCNASILYNMYRKNRCRFMMPRSYGCKCFSKHLFFLLQCILAGSPWIVRYTRDAGMGITVCLYIQHNMSCLHTTTLHLQFWEFWRGHPFIPLHFRQNLCSFASCRLCVEVACIMTIAYMPKSFKLSGFKLKIQNKHGYVLSLYYIFCITDHCFSLTLPKGIAGTLQN